MKETILVIEDEVGPRESIKMILKPYYNVVAAEDGAKALALLQNQEIDLVTLDLKMPGLCGDEVLKQIKRVKPEMEVIIISGQGSVKSAIDGIHHGAGDYLLKPFAISDLLNTIEKTLSRRKKVKELKNFLSEVTHKFGLKTK